VNIDNIVVDSC